jgi:hypothetical protein
MLYTTSGARKTRHLLAVTIVVATAVSSACSGRSGDAGKQQGGTGATTGAPDSGRTGARAVRTTPAVPRLPKKIEDITADEFLEVIKDVDWTGHLVKRQCDGETGCDAAGTKVTWVRHEAAAGANDLAFDTIPANGVVISRMQNIGKFKEGFYQLPGGKSEWYVVLTPAVNARTATAQFVSLDFQGNGTAKLDTMRKRLRVTICEAGRHDSTDAGFKECPVGNSGQANPAPTPFALPTSFNKGAWFTCSLGCCTTEGVRGNSREKVPDSTKTDSATRDSTKRQQRSG